ncbi:MAG: hypothetical protein COU35_01580 [Candidatus Magasanikbacteria bacterium CG10_big_fil_rev_8_21_14_0_10_47_10]|uniref:Uncharacterized protein n=1 Tax=Candidatus Magasanikbacteria bacterium CG10_big_fil_rev_8_21_14_0_10_47_10 TaxID=1974652 RepID=A0A2H0TR21_9BACT|nr:MAG: hypothetical protein COU35_01580 [Candidatus Magasanikbacteria bacterium CG10_big_fil_rev_8_21_14_0_10_47_10]
MEHKKTPETASDMQYALFLIGHINAPCADEAGNNLREFYLKEARIALATMKNPSAQKLLQETIEEYST